jgi:hypothetical protein
MSDVTTSVRQLIQDLVAPDLKAANTKLEGLKELVEANHKHSIERTDLLLKLAQERTDAQYNALTTQLEAFRAEMRSEFASLRAQSTLQVREPVGPLEGRLQVLEAARTLR